MEYYSLQNNPPNKKKIIENFDILISHLKESKDRRDTYRIISYNNAKATISTFEGSGENEDILINDLPKLKSLIGKGSGIGQKTYEKIKEILETSKLKKAEKIKEEQTPEEKLKNETIDLFLKVTGAGKRDANKWYRQGYRTINDLKKIPLTLLQRDQYLTIKYFEDLNKRISRVEICFYDIFLKAYLKILEKIINVKIKYEIVGSYRRGQQSSGDIDMIIGIDDHVYDKNKFLEELLKFLIKEEILCDYIKKGEKVIHGLSKLRNPLYKKLISKFKNKYPLLNNYENLPIRKFDIWLVPNIHIQWVFSLLGRTGSKVSVQRMRTIVKKEGKYLLNDYGLIDNKTGDYINELYPDLFKTEKDIYNYLSIPYQEPNKR